MTPYYSPEDRNYESEVIRKYREAARVDNVSYLEKCLAVQTAYLHDEDNILGLNTEHDTGY